MTALQIFMIIIGLMSFTTVVGNGLAIYGGREGLSNRTRKALIITLAACVLLFPLAGQACGYEGVEAAEYVTCDLWRCLR